MDIGQLYEKLNEAASFTGDVAALRIVSEYQPIGGASSRVFPPTYPVSAGTPESEKYLQESRWTAGGSRSDILLDAVPSQANRAEEALLRARREGEIEIPLLQLDHHGAIDVTLTSLEFPHRYADAYLRDSLLDGTAFDKTDLGRSFRAASLADARALYAHDPGSLVFGAWDSHRKGRQQKFPRVYASEIIGWDPVLGSRKAGRMDPLNLTGAAKPQKDGWEFAATGAKIKGEKLSEIGHGNVAPNPQHGGVTISGAQRTATLSFAGLDRIGFGDTPRAAAVAARALLASYALLADRLAFAGPSLWLRSGCELALTDERIELVRRQGAPEIAELNRADAVELFRLAAERVTKEGLPLVTETVRLTPSTNLAKAIDFALTRAEGGED